VVSSVPKEKGKGTKGWTKKKTEVCGVAGLKVLTEKHDAGSVGNVNSAKGGGSKSKGQGAKK